MALEASHDLELGTMINNSRESMDLTPVVTEWRD
jgi:hypothetical protein